MKRWNKKGIELSANFLVILILSIVIFGGGLALVNKFFKSASEKQTELDQSTLNEIEKLLNDGSKVAIPIHKKEMKIGDEQLFGLGIYNVLGSQHEFTVTVDFDEAYDEEDELMTEVDGGFVDSRWHFFDSGRKYTVKNNDYQAVKILLKVDSVVADGIPTRKGLYIFNVNVSMSNGEFYDGHMHKLYVDIK